MHGACQTRRAAIAAARRVKLCCVLHLFPSDKFVSAAEIVSWMPRVRIGYTSVSQLSAHPAVSANWETVRRFGPTSPISEAIP